MKFDCHIDGLFRGFTPDNKSINSSVTKSRTWQMFALLLMLPTVVWAGESQQPADEVFLFLEDAIAIAIEDNPSLSEMQACYEALEVPSQVGTLPDPILSLNAMNLPTDTFSVGQKPMTQLQLTVSQAIPFPGKLSLQESASGRVSG